MQADIIRETTASTSEEVKVEEKKEEEKKRWRGIEATWTDLTEKRTSRKYLKRESDLFLYTMYLLWKWNASRLVDKFFVM